MGHLHCDPENTPPAPPPPPPPPPPAPKKIESLQGAHFDFNKADLKPTGKERLDHVAKTLQDNPNMRVTCEGHTDSIGSDAYNQKLSERRAKPARAHPTPQGTPSSPASAGAMGKGGPGAQQRN